MYDSFIRLHAQHRPHAVAIVKSRGDVTYRQLNDEIDRLSSALAEAGLSGLRLAAVGIADPHVSWLILLAFARLGVGTVTFYGPYSQAVSMLAPDAIVMDAVDGSQNVAGTKTLHASADWLREALGQEATELPLVVSNPDALGRITLTSGATGKPKAVARSWRQVADTVAYRILTNSAVRSTSGAPTDRLINLFGTDTSAFFLVLSIWATGGTVIMHSLEIFQREDELHRLAPTLLLASPVQLQLMLKLLPPNCMPMPGLSIMTRGSHMPAVLRQTLQMRLTPTIWNFYGSSEAATIAIAQLALLGDDLAAAGWVVPGAKVQIVDGQDLALPAGETGLVRVRTPASVSGYFDDEETTARHFRQGWFYPGDLGSLSADGFLRIEGRSDDMMNLGGVKLLPRIFEDAVLECAGVLDAAAFGVPDASGVTRPWLAIVRGEGLVEAELSRAIGTRSLPQVTIVWTESIPRNDGGKVQRDKLRSAVLLKLSQAS